VESFHGDYLRPEEVTPYLDGVKKKAPRYYSILRSKSLGHSDTATTEKHYASLAPGAARELPNVIEQTVRNAAVRNANQMRTEGVEDGTPLSGESVTV